MSVYRSARDQVAELALKGPLFNVWAMLTPDELRTVAGMCLAAARDIEAEHGAPLAKVA